MQTCYVNTYYVQKYKKNKHIGTLETHVGKQSVYHMAEIRRENPLRFATGGTGFRKRNCGSVTITYVRRFW